MTSIVWPAKAMKLSGVITTLSHTATLVAIVLTALAVIAILVVAVVVVLLVYSVDRDERRKVIKSLTPTLERLAQAIAVPRAAIRLRVRLRRRRKHQAKCRK